MSTQHKNIIAAIEAALFVYGEPISPKKLAALLDVEESALREGLGYIQEKLRMEERGLALVWNEDEVQLATKPAFATLVESLAKKEFVEALTPAALETLSIIVYAGRISRADIEYIRGVNSSFTVRNLLMRGLVERESDPERPHSYLYKPTFDFIRRLGLTATEELPDYKKYQDLIHTLHHDTESQQPASDSPQSK